MHEWVAVCLLIFIIITGRVDVGLIILCTHFVKKAY